MPENISLINLQEQTWIYDARTGNGGVGELQLVSLTAIIVNV